MAASSRRRLRSGDPQLRRDRRGDRRRARPDRRRRGRHPRPRPRRRAARAPDKTRGTPRLAARGQGAAGARAGRAARAGPANRRAERLATLPAPAGRGLARGVLREPRLRGPLGARCHRARAQADGLGARSLHPAASGGKLNTTDPDARRMKQGRAFLPRLQRSGCHHREPDRGRCRAHDRGVDFQQLEPMIASASESSDAPELRTTRGRARRRRLLV